MSCGCSARRVIGSTVTVDMTFDDGEEQNPTPVNPTGITVKVLGPDGTTTTYTEADPEVTGGTPTGEWEFTFTPAAPGEYAVYVVGATTNGQAASATSFTINDVPVPLP